MQCFFFLLLSIDRNSVQPLRHRLASTVHRKPMNQMSNRMANSINDSDNYGYITFGDVPPPLPPRKKAADF